MTNKILLTIIILLLVCALIDWVLPSSIEFTFDNVLFPSLALYAGLLMMLINGTFVTRRYYTIARAAIAAYMLGVVFKILHLTGADQILIISVLLLVILYTLHFVAKQRKKVLDYLKMLTVIFLAAAPLRMLHLVSGEIRYTLDVLHTIIFWITFLVFLKVQWSERKQTDAA
ncbi:hypothetical protein [Parachryseolinea silvisoli]|uniref:hypothetical protein n=1 Tax=Parachryseolinea silvisoli TaxID=2873601 RepID=UPI002265DA2E|nr:hypothetical protein [Parachryseolinea silvisoli]MCD9019536.1 hypothetical protein [Parachryseolinea silvisoli]